MSSRASTPVDSDDDFGDLRGAMNTSSPVRPAATVSSKRNHETMAGDANADNDDVSGAALTLSSLASQNIVGRVKHHAEKKRLRVDQVTEVGVFVNEPPVVREAKLLVEIIAARNELEKIVASKPAYEVSAELETNLRKYAPAVLLSSKLTWYKGNGPKEILLNIAKHFRFGMPAGLENIPADWAKVTYVAGDALTQTRSSFKKLLGKSVGVKYDMKKDYAPKFSPPSAQQNIFDLAQLIVKGTPSSVNVELCARIALMRSVYLKHPGKEFWDKLDKRLLKIRQEADGDTKKIVKAFRHILTHDQDTCGTKNYVLPDRAADDFQQRVDNIIEIGDLDMLTSVQADGNVDGDGNA
ncbi:hypothetical protein B0H16DRAFT_1742636 [Mycena metata]|uniref:Uncharacterized protein n=1 Tax=Mycena metata TaxID=1033252 RepID=A0AAD7MFH6_9AGAR|nr:hypothetical protein B0H16DRAFT_1742636 [Mycena metata]